MVDEAVRAMLETGIIERFESPWSFSIVVVNKKKMTGTGFAWTLGN